MKVRVPVRGVRLPAMVDARMVEQAAEQGISLSEFIRRAVSREVGLWGPPRVPEEQPEALVEPLTWGDEPHVERTMPRKTAEAVRRAREQRGSREAPEARIRQLEPEEVLAAVREVPSVWEEDLQEAVPAGQRPTVTLQGGPKRCGCGVRQPRLGGRCTVCWGV